MTVQLPPTRSVTSDLDALVDEKLVIQIDAWNIRERDHWGQPSPHEIQGRPTAQ